MKTLSWNAKQKVTTWPVFRFTDFYSKKTLAPFKIHQVKLNAKKSMVKPSLLEDFNQRRQKLKMTLRTPNKLRLSPNRLLQQERGTLTIRPNTTLTKIVNQSLKPSLNMKHHPSSPFSSILRLIVKKRKNVRSAPYKSRMLFHPAASSGPCKTTHQQAKSFWWLLAASAIRCWGLIRTLF